MAADVVSNWISDPRPFNLVLQLAGVHHRDAGSGLTSLLTHPSKYSKPGPGDIDLEVLLPAPQRWSISRGSVYRGEADAATKQFVQRLGLRSYEKFRILGVHLADCMLGTSVSADVLAAIANLMGLLFFVDDLCFDVENLPTYQLPEDACGAAASALDRAATKSSGGNYVSRLNPARVREFTARSWIGMLRSREPPLPPPDSPVHGESASDLYAPVEMAVWEAGRDLRRLSASNPDWYDHLVDAVQDFTAACHGVQDDLAASVQDVHSYSHSRARTAGALVTIALLEVANQCFLPPELRAHPTMQQLVWAAGMHIACVNDIFSYTKEEHNRDRDYCLIRLLMRVEGMSLAQAVRCAVTMTNCYAYAMTTLAARLNACCSEFGMDSAVSSSSSLRRFVQAVREQVFGDVHFHMTSDRYVWPIH